MGSITDYPVQEFAPDILIPYTMSREELSNATMVIISVRPETNYARYEAAIIRAIAPIGRVVYMANLAGPLINDRAIVARHYSSQLEFAVNGKKEMAKYPEMIEKFEKKFNVPFHDACIIGSYEAVIEHIKKDPEELFHTMVSGSDFLECYGQTIKKIEGFYVLNYDIPAILTRHNEKTNVFIIAVRFKDPGVHLAEVDHVIYNNLCQGEATYILDAEIRQDLAWFNLVRRTYHISRSHIEAMFDLTDYVFKNKNQSIHFSETPLGVALLDRDILSPDHLEERLKLLKDNPLVYIDEPNGIQKLVNIIWAGKVQKQSTFIEKSLDECCHLVKKINWEKLIKHS